MITSIYLIIFVFLTFILCSIVVIRDKGLYKSFLAGVCVGVTMGVLQWLTIN